MGFLLDSIQNHKQLKNVNMGRPKKKIEEIKLFQINLRVTLNEQVELEEAAKSHGLNVVEFIRRRALHKQLPKFSMSGLERDLLIELSRIGSNINQMSKKVNQGNPNLKGLEEELLNLNKKLKEIKNQLLV
jgi:septal ring factor EnvC (AmiA/AmiB activator)